MIQNFVLIVGAMKCGTTSLFNSLSQHPEIAACRYKEPRFFTKNFSKGFDYYQSLWDWDSQNHKYALEATPGYTKINNKDGFNAAENIALTQAEQQVNFKFIYIMRHPLERIESHYIHDISKSNHKIDNSVLKVKQEIIDTSKYAWQISEFYQRFPKENILLINFEELKGNSSKLLDEICQFLAIDNSFEFKQTQVKHNSRQRLRTSIPGWHKLRNVSAIKYLSSRVSEQQKQTFKGVFGSKKDINFKLEPELRQNIINELKPDLRELHDKYQFDFRNWQLDTDIY